MSNVKFTQKYSEILANQGQVILPFRKAYVRKLLKARLNRSAYRSKNYSVLVLLATAQHLIKHLNLTFSTIFVYIFRHKLKFVKTA